MLDLKNSSVGAFINEESSWPSPGKLQIEGFTYGRMSKGRGNTDPDWVKWIELQPEETLLPQPFRQLAKFLRDNGSDYRSRRVLYQMEQHRRRRELLSLTGLRFGREWAAGLLSRMVGFGYFPGWALWWLLALALSGTGVYWVAYAIGSVAPTDKDTYLLFQTCQCLPPHYERFHASIYSLENSFPALRLGQAERWQPDPSSIHSASASGFAVQALFSPRHLRVFRWIQVCLGWFFASLFVAAVSGIVRKD
jgi:hypothetical protein